MTAPPGPPAAIEPEKRRRRLPGPAVVLAVVAVLMLASVLAFFGVSHGHGGGDQLGPETTENAGRVPAGVRDGGAVVTPSATGAASRAVPRGTVALTFDDGPDPLWTPQILDILRRHQVPATFFVVGSRASQYPDLVKRIHDEGSELGLHSFSHPDLAQTSDWRFERELHETQMAIVGATGTTTYLMRPPYSAGTSSIDDSSYTTVARAGTFGYTTVFTDADSEDWQRPGVDAIVRNAHPDPRVGGGTVLMHDTGGDRSQTVAALDRLIPQMKAEGFRFTTTSAAVGLPPAARPASEDEQFYGDALLGAVSLANGIVAALTAALLAVGVLVLLRFLIMIVIAGVHRRRRRRPDFRWGPPVTEPVSVIVPAYNEKENIAATVRSLAASRHPVEILVVDDGSDDGTADIAESLRLPNVRVLRQVNGGKPAALNNGIAHARHDLVVMIDGDTVFEPDTIPRLVQPFADARVGAVSGNAKVAAGANGRRALIAAWQHIEYVIGFNIDRRVYDVLGCMPTIPGAVGAFRRKVLLSVGGVSDETLAEDTDLTMAICRAGWWVVYEETALAWTEAPATLGQLWRQRYRWSYGTMQAMWKHRHAVVERGSSGRFGRLGLSHLALFGLVLPTFAPLVDLFLLYGLVFLDPLATLTAWASVLAVQLVGALYAFRLEREKLRVLWLLPFQQLVYRQMMYAVLLRSIATALSGIRLKWQKLRRVGGLDALVEGGAGGPASGVGGPVPLSGASLPPGMPRPAPPSAPRTPPPGTPAAGGPRPGYRPPPGRGGPSGAPPDRVRAGQGPGRRSP